MDKNNWKINLNNLMNIYDLKIITNIRRPAPATADGARAAPATADGARALYFE